jgi:NagD protein
MRDLEIIRSKRGFISDMDGVIYQGSQLLPGVKEFVDWLRKEKKQFLFLTNSSERTPLELHKKLLAMGIDIDESHFYTSALATAQFLKTQAPGSSAYIIGAHGLMNALYDAGIPFNDVNPDYVVVGETTGYNYEMLSRQHSSSIKGPSSLPQTPILQVPAIEASSLRAAPSLPPSNLLREWPPTSSASLILL